MEHINERKQNLKDILQLIERSATYNETNFNTLYNSIVNELAREKSRLNGKLKNTYMENLQTTIDKQVADYKEAEPNYKHVEYFRFLKSFREDIIDELERLEKYG